MTMSHKARINRTAEANGWAVHAEPEPERIGVTEYRKKNGRKVAYVRVMFGVLNQVTEASWADNLQGFNGRAIGNHNADKLEWVLGRLEGEQR
jgi:hypothetical protein